MNDITERNNFGWPKQQYAKEQPSPSFVDRMPKARGDTGFSSSNGGYFNEQMTRGTASTGIAVVPDALYQQERQQARKGRGSASENNMRNSIAYPIRKAVPDEDDHLNDLLQVPRKGRGSASENNMRNSVAYPTRKAVSDEDDHLNDLLQVLQYCFCSICRYSMTRHGFDFY
jgi:hypothetical protein